MDLKDKSERSDGNRRDFRRFHQTLRRKANTDNVLDIERSVSEHVLPVLARGQHRVSFTEGYKFTNNDVFYAVKKDDIKRMTEIIGNIQYLVNIFVIVNVFLFLNLL